MTICNWCKKKFTVEGGVLIYHLKGKRDLKFCSIPCMNQNCNGWVGRKVSRYPLKSEGSR